MKKLLFLGLSLCCFMIFQSCNNSGKSSKEKADSINRANKMAAQETSDFLVDASIINLTEIKLGAMAMKQATLSRVKNYASMIVSQHKELQNKLQELASKENIFIPDSLKKGQPNKGTKLKLKSGESLDRSFINEMKKGHKKAIQKYKNAADSIHNKEVNHYIQQALPWLKEHLDSAEAIQKDIGKGKDKTIKSTPTMPLRKS